MFPWLRENDGGTFLEFFFSTPPFFCQRTLRLPRLLLERSRDGCDPDGFISPLQKGSYGEHFPPVESVVKDFCIIYRPPCYRAAPRSDKAAPLQENGFFLQWISDKDDKRDGCGRGDEWGGGERQKGDTPTQPPTQNQLIFLTRVRVSYRLTPPNPRPHPHPPGPDKGGSLHPRRRQIRHLFRAEGSKSSAQAVNPSLLIFISRARDDPKLPSRRRHQ